MKFIASALPGRVYNSSAKFWKLKNAEKQFFVRAVENFDNFISYFNVCLFAARIQAAADVGQCDQIGQFIGLWASF